MGRGLAGRRYGRRSRPAARRLAGWPGPRMMFGLTGFSGRLTEWRPARGLDCPRALLGPFLLQSVIPIGDRQATTWLSHLKVATLVNLLPCPRVLRARPGAYGFTGCALLLLSSFAFPCCCIPPGRAGFSCLNIPLYVNCRAVGLAC